MPTGTETNPFHPGPPPSRAELEAYLRGSLAQDRAHQVERHMEADPLLREAAEGLALPGALEALPDLRRAHGRGGTGGLMLLTAAALLLAGGAWWLLQENGTHAPDTLAEELPAITARTETVPPAVVGTEDAPEQVVPEATPREARDLHHRAVALDTTVPREQGVEPLAGRAIQPPLPDPAPPRPLRTVRSGHRLVFLHDLKLVDPAELYPVDPLVNAGSEGVDARFADRSSQEAAREPLRTMRYLDFMERALGHFTRQDQRATLQELEFLLKQYPDDVNARFYAALCNYQLGRHTEALEGFSRVAAHEVDSFAEEARWYRALSTERAKGRDAARPLYTAVADGGGFYSGRARERLAVISPAP